MLSEVNMNKALLVGRITNDLQIYKTQSNQSSLYFTIACDEGKDRNGNQITNFVSCKAWDKTADNIAQYFKKGDGIGVEGKNQQYKHDVNGVTVYDQYVMVTRFEFLPSKKSNSQNNQQNTYQEQSTESGLDIGSDDLPF